MKWVKQPNGDWMAQGEHGHFLIWKYGNIYKGFYMHEIGRIVKFRFFAKSLKEAKEMCEGNYHWES